VEDVEFRRRWPLPGYIPEHVPAELVRPHNILTDPETRKCPYAAINKLRDGPRIFWNTESFQFGGAWIPTKAEDIRFILSNPQLFSNRHEAGFSAMLGKDWDLVPLELDPPEHGVYRRLLNPLMSPPVIAKLAPKVVARADELIDRFVGSGQCEFMEAFGRPFPVSIFMDLMGLPADMTDTFNRWEYELLHHPDEGARVRAAGEINTFLVDLAAERRARPTSDLTSAVVSAQIDGQPLTDDRVIGILYLLFVGGLDTVASSLGFFFRHLAEHQDDQKRLRERPDEIPHAVEELLRRFSVVTVNRQCQADIEVGGVQMKAGDWISLMTPFASTDPDEFDRPLDVDLDRKAPRHLAFSFGPHFCMGSHLARRELVVALQQWLSKVPPFRIKHDEELVAHGSGVFGIDRMVLTWS
jgi:cytochrome P450